MPTLTIGFPILISMGFRLSTFTYNSLEETVIRTSEAAFVIFIVKSTQLYFGTFDIGEGMMKLTVSTIVLLGYLVLVILTVKKYSTSNANFCTDILVTGSNIFDFPRFEHPT